MRWLWRAVPAVLVLTALAMLAVPRGGDTVPLFAARQGLMCGSCHFDPNGGGPRNDFGFAFARNRHSLEAEADTASEWHDLNIANRVGENVPIYFGVNHRLLLLDNTTVQSDSLDRFAFFNMENSIHLAIQPHPRLALVHTRDGSSPKETFGWIGGFPFDGYLKAGSFRIPYGVRLDDHTVATRNSFLDFYYPYAQSQPWGFAVRERFLPYDPRDVDHGLEVGASGSGFFGRVSYTNGASNLFGGGPFGPNPYAETKSIKLGYNMSGYQGGISFYDDFQKTMPAFGAKRATRWGYYGMTHAGRFALLGEIGAGTDQMSGRKVNSLAGFAELNYAFSRGINVRLRYDHLNLDRDRTELAPGVRLTDLNTHQRYSIEGEFVPVPFAELRWTLRFIEHEAATDPVGLAIPDETQGYLQFHFSY